MTTASPTRRQRNRASTTEAIKRAAMAQIRAGGAASLSIRGIGRQIGLSPAGLYRYYDSIEDLLTELITDTYTSLADAVGLAAEHTDGSPLRRLRAAVLAYRTWALADPNAFLLIFGTPIPGYAAPEAGPTVTANQRMGGVFLGLTSQAWAAHEIARASLPEQAPGSPAEAALLATLREHAPDFPASMIPDMLGGWALWHGMVTLEVIGQLDWIYPDAEAFFTSQVDAWLAHLAGSAPDEHLRDREGQLQ